MKYGGSVRSNRTDPSPPCLEGQPRLVQTRRTAWPLQAVISRDINKEAYH